MPLAIQKLTLEEYLTYDDGTEARYELVDGVLVDMGSESPLNVQIAVFLLLCFAQLGVPHYHLAIGHQIGVSPTKPTARQPDLLVHSEASEAAISADGKLLRFEMPAPMLVVEVVSSSDTDPKSRDDLRSVGDHRDYIEKRSEYAARGIPEYWIVDPVEGQITICVLVRQAYDSVEFQGDAAIASPTFPELKLTANSVLMAGR